MARVKRATNAHKKRKVVLERASGYRGQRSRLYRKAKEQVTHSLVYAYRDRRARKGDFRRLWIQRINAAARENGITYNRFHVTALCSPTRAALLTGRNHHAVGFGSIAEFAGGWPGYNATWPKSAASIARILQGNGYSTAAVGNPSSLRPLTLTRRALRPLTRQREIVFVETLNRLLTSSRVSIGSTACSAGTAGTDFATRRMNSARSWRRSSPPMRRSACASDR